MTDSSMNFGPAWIRNLRSEGTTTGGGTGGSSKYQLAEYRYGKEEMLAFFDKNMKAPPSLVGFKSLYSEQTLAPMALLPSSSEEDRGWSTRPTTIGGPTRGRGGALERGGRGGRGRGGYQTYGRATSAYDSGWGNGEQPDWSPRKEFNPTRSTSTFMDNWRRVRNDEDEGWRSISSAGRPPTHEKWGRQTSWRGEGDNEERNGPPERGGRATWQEGLSNRGPPRRSWDEDHLPEWAMENPTEGGGTFDERGAFHGSDDEHPEKVGGMKKDTLQKSTSQQHITSKVQHPSLLTPSKSAVSIPKFEESSKVKEDYIVNEEVKFKEVEPPEKRIPEPTTAKEIKEASVKRPESVLKVAEKVCSSNGSPQDAFVPTTSENRTLDGPKQSYNNKTEEDFGRFQEDFGEDFVRKLVVDEDTPKHAQVPFSDVSPVQPPPNLSAPLEEKWFYQDPQGMRQGPFENAEMEEWYKAGYFSNQLNIMRECDERYFLLGDLVDTCGIERPFSSSHRFPVMKNDTPSGMAAYMALVALKQQQMNRNITEPWGAALSLQQQEMAANQRLLLQSQQSVPDIAGFIPPPQQNPLMVMINQMQQTNKLSGLVEKPPSSIPNQLDPLFVHHGANIHSPLPNRLPLHNHLTSTGLPQNLVNTPLQSEGIGGGLPGLQQLQPNSLSAAMPGLYASLAAAAGGPAGGVLQRPGGPLDQIPGGVPPVSQQDTDSISLFMKQFQQLNKMQQQQQVQQQVDPLPWQKSSPPPMSGPWPQPQEQQQSQPPPTSLWDIPQQNADVGQNVPTVEQQNNLNLVIPQQVVLPGASQDPQKDKEPKSKEDMATSSQKELKKRKELEEKQARKEAEDRRKLEQKKQEAEKKAAEEKKRKEEEKIRRELEKAKKEAEDKRLRELEEKRRLKEQRKAEEEARKKADELRKEEEKNRREAKEKEKEERRQAEMAKQSSAAAARAAKSAPWCQSNSSQGMSLTDIQKAEKEKRAQEATMQLQKQQLMEQQQQQVQIEKQGGIQLSWAKKPVETRKVKSFAEIQAEEQERLAKVAAEARLAAQQKEKEAPPAASAGSIWNGQSLTWANASSTSQWSSNSGKAGGFWDDVPAKSSNKPSTVSKSNSTSAMTNSVKQQQSQQQKQQQQTKPKAKRDDSSKSVNNNNNSSSHDEFTNWCYRSLSNISADVDIPTFVTFLLDIESAYDVRDYCKEYLGESGATQQFTSSFLEKRRSFKQPKSSAHKDDMCSPAPAITPSMQHSNEFQEVKGKNKKNKNKKMMKLDKSILGFNVTSAPDRINVGDRDYGDNS